jgi:hypothetical protein
MFATRVAVRGSRFWLPVVAAFSVATFALGLATGSGLLRMPAAQYLPARGAVEGVVGTGAPAAPVPSNSMSDAAWQTLYGPTAATWGVWGVRSTSMSDAAWQALYGPTAATWGVWGVRSTSMSDAAGALRSAEVRPPATSRP